MKRIATSLLSLCLLALCACSGAPAPKPSYRGTLPSPKPSHTQPAAPSETKKPSAAPERTEAPTSEPTPSPTPAPTPEPTPSPTPEPTPEPTNEPVQNPPSSPSGGGNSGGGGDGSNFQTWDNPDQQQTSQNWVLNTNTMKVHYPSCSSVPRIAPHNYATSSAPLDELLSRGYSRCGRCF